jgi:hypothetical protein
MESLTAGLDDLVTLLTRFVEVVFADEPEAEEEMRDRMAPAEELLMDMRRVWPHLAGCMRTKEPSQETLDLGVPGARTPRA